MLARIVVVGANGAGKTWLAKRLAECLEARLIQKDALALTTGWVQRPQEDVQADLRRLIEAEAWVLEGGPSILSPAVLESATLIVWLDIPRRVRLWRIVRRSLRYIGRTRPEHPIGNRDWPGKRQLSFAWRAWVQDDAFRDRIADALQDLPQPILYLNSASETLDFVETAGQCAERL